MPLYKVSSGTEKQVVAPKVWTLVKFPHEGVFDFDADGWSLMGVLLRVEYPRGKFRCPKTLRGRFVRWPNTDHEDWTGFDDKDPQPGKKRHHYWSHFVLNKPDLSMGFKVWHNGRVPIVLDGRQFKWTTL